MKKEIDNSNLFDPHAVEMSDDEIAAFWDKVEKELFKKPDNEEKTSQHKTPRR
jgi:hypothetical protein